MYVLTLKRQKVLTKQYIYAEGMSTWIQRLKELVNIKPIVSTMALRMLFFRCPEGHFTKCDTPKHRLIFCKDCNLLRPKQDCERYTDRLPVLRKFSKSKRIQYEGTSLYQYPESYRRNYRNEYWKRKARENRMSA